MSDQIKVVIRARPLIQREENSQMQINWIVENDTIKSVDRSSNNKSNHVFQFDKIFDVASSNWHVYVESVQHIVKAAMHGFNGTIFAYGQTSSGKTHTIMGNDTHWGVIPYSINEIFETIENTPDREFLLRISYMEIYNETVMDLLSGQTRLKVKEAPNGDVYVADLKEEIVRSPETIFAMLESGEAKRHFGETNMNERSSRSHTIFRIVIESRILNSSDTASENQDGDGIVIVSHLNIVDLAGSERTGQTGATGDRLKEGCAINKSLFTLSNVISKLSDVGASSSASGTSGEAPFVNFRDSKLTRILQNSLGGNSKTAIICTITPAAVEETISTLKFASRAKIIKNKPVKNEIISDETMLRRCQNQINELKKQIHDLGEASNLQALQQEKDVLTKQLNEKEDKIAQLMKLVCISSKISLTPMKLDSKTINRNRRITWCPGRGNQANLDFHGRRFQNIDFPPLRELQPINETPQFLSLPSESTSESQNNDDQEELIGNLFTESNEAQEIANICETLMTEKQTLEQNLKSTNAELEKLRNDFEFVSNICHDTQKLYDDLKRDYEKKFEAPLNSTAEFVHLELAAYETTSAEFMKEIDDLKKSLETLKKSNFELTKERDEANKQCEELFLENWQTKKKFANAEKMQLDIERKNVLIKDLMNEIDELKKISVTVSEPKNSKLTSNNVCIDVNVQTDLVVNRADADVQTDLITEEKELSAAQIFSNVNVQTADVDIQTDRSVVCADADIQTDRSVVCADADIQTDRSVVCADADVQTDLITEEKELSALLFTNIEVQTNRSVIYADTDVQTDTNVVYTDGEVQTDMYLVCADGEGQGVNHADADVQTDSIFGEKELSAVFINVDVQTDTSFVCSGTDVPTYLNVVCADADVQTDFIAEEKELSVAQNFVNVDVQTDTSVVCDDADVQTDFNLDHVERECLRYQSLSDQLQIQLNKVISENKRQSSEIEHLRVGISDLNEVSREQLTQAEIAINEKNEEIENLKVCLKEIECRLRAVNESAQDAELKRLDVSRRLQEVQQEKNLLADRATEAEHRLKLNMLENSNLESYKNKLLMKDKDIERIKKGLENMTKQYEDACDLADEEEKIFKEKLAEYERQLAERDRLIAEMRNKSNECENFAHLLKENEKFRMSNDKLLKELHQAKMNLVEMNSKLTLADDPWRNRLAIKERECRNKEEQIQNLKNDLRRMQEQQNFAEPTIPLPSASMSSSTKPVIAGWTASGSGIMDTHRIYELDNQNHRLSKTVSQLQKELMDAKTELDKLRSKVNELEKEKISFNASEVSSNGQHRSAMSSLLTPKVSGSRTKKLTKMVSESPATHREKYDIGSSQKQDNCKQQ